MQAIKPYSALTSSDFDVTDFPACDLAITADSFTASGVKTFTDLVSSIAFSHATITWTLDGSGGFAPSAIGTFTHAAITGHGSKDGMLITVGSQPDGTIIGFGVGWLTYINAIGTGNGALERGLNQSLTFPAVTKAGLTNGAILQTFDNSAGTADIYMCDDVATVYETQAYTAGSGTITGTWDDFIANTFQIYVAAPTNLWGVYLLSFTTRPDAVECKKAVGWMSANPTKGLYPGWKGIE